MHKIASQVSGRSTKMRFYHNVHRRQFVPHGNTLVWDICCHRNINYLFSSYVVTVTASRGACT